MKKKSSSSSNVPAQAKPASSTNNKPKTSPQKSNNGSLHHGNGSTVLNSKHLHNQSHQQKSKKSDNLNAQNGSASDLMKKLSEAVQKQQKEKEKEQEYAYNTNIHGAYTYNSSSTNNSGNITKRSRKGTAPAGIMQNNTTYAGAAFDRAPAATSFPIPSFIKSPNLKTTDPDNTNTTVLSQSCPLPSSLESPSMKTLSISELFPTEGGGGGGEVNEKKKLDSLTNDLRKLLNLK